MQITQSQPTRVEGRVLNVRVSDQRLPHTLGRTLAMISVIVFIISTSLVVLLFGLVAIIFGCAVTPVVMGIVGSFIVAWRKLVLRNDQVQQTSFDVNVIQNNTITSVVHFSDRGGNAALVDGDIVHVTGKLLANSNTLLSQTTEVRRRNGMILNPPALLKGKQPISVFAGAIWIGIASLPLLIFLSLIMGGR